MKAGITDRENVTRDVRDLQNNALVTLSRQEARDLIDALSGFDGDEDAVLATALDYAQGEDDPAARYVIIYVTP